MRMLYRCDGIKDRPWLRVSVLLAVTGPTVYFTIRQFLPNRIPHNEAPPSCTGYVWETADQVAYGYPEPVVRFLDVPDPLHGSTFIDWTALLLSIWLLLFFVFLLLECIGILNWLTRKKIQPQNT